MSEAAPQIETSTTDQQEAPPAKVKAPRKPRTPKAEQPAAPAPKAKTTKKQVAQPTQELYSFRSGWTGPSDGANKNVSRTKIDPASFNRYPMGNMTERDDKNLKALKGQFGVGKPFARQNVDAGIIRRLMERGFVQHKSGNPDARDGMFVLTKKAA